MGPRQSLEEGEGMGIFVPWLADAARATGYPVVEERNWQTRGSGGAGMTKVEGVAGHHTAGPRLGEYPCRNIILSGRTGLPGPLANFGLGRSGTIYVVAAGRANHAGVSEWAGFSNLNGYFLGIEAEDDGDGTWTPEQRDCYPRLVASLLHYMRRPVSRYAGHKDIALPRGRKPDPAGIDTTWMRNKAGVYLANTASINRHYRPTVTPTPVKEEPVTETEKNEIAQKVFNLLQPLGGQPLGTEVDMLRRDVRELATGLNKLLFHIEQQGLTVTGAVDNVVES